MNCRYAKIRNPIAPRAKCRRSRFVLASLGLVAVFSVVGYLVQVSSTSAKSSEIRRLEQEVASLKDERVRAELQLAQGQAFSAVDSKIQRLGMVPADRLEYVEPTSAALARK